MKRLLLLVVLIAGVPGRSLAQTPAARPAPRAVPNALPSGVPCADGLGSLRTAKTSDAKDLAASDLVKPDPTCFSEIVLSGGMERAGYANFLKQFETVRTDKQVGTSAGSGGTTTPVAKGTTASVLSLAAEYGALTESVSNQVITVQGSLDGVPAALVRHSLVPYCPTNASSPDCVNATAFEWLRRISYAVSFDTILGSAGAVGTPASTTASSVQPVTFDASGHEITGATVKVVLWNARDATSAAYQKKWMDRVKKGAAVPATATAAAQPASPLLQAAASLGDAMSALLDKIAVDPTCLAWEKETKERLLAAKAGELTDVWLDRTRVLTAVAQHIDVNVATNAATFMRQYRVYRFEEDDLIRDVAEKPVLTLQYDYKRPPSAPATSTVRLAFDKAFDAHWSVTANGAVEYYDQQPSADIPDASRFRDGQFGVQVQYDLGRLAMLGAAAISGTYYFQYQNSPAILNVTPATPLSGITFVSLPSTATQVFADKGNLSLAQLRLVLGPSDSSARFPVAISYSNRTELIAKPVWRAQIGVSYDFDSLFAK